MLSRLPIPAVGTDAYRQWRRGEGPYAPQTIRLNEATISELSALDRRLSDLQSRLDRLPDEQPSEVAEPARRSLTEVDTTDPAWIERHEAWLCTEQGRAYAAEQAMPWEDRAADIREQHRAERLRDARQADVSANRLRGTRHATVGAR